MCDNEKSFEVLVNNIAYRMWLEKMGLRETHAIAWIVEYGKEFKREKL